MLYQHKILDLPDQGDGIKRSRILDELEPMPCEVCGGESVPNICEADGRYHHHGQVHLFSGSLKALCAVHGSKESQKAMLQVARQINGRG